MSTPAILVGILVGWASSACWRNASMGNAWVNRLIGVVGGLIGAYLAVTIGAGSGDPIATAIWAWAGAIVLGDVIALVTGGNS